MTFLETIGKNYCRRCVDRPEDTLK